MEPRPPASGLLDFRGKVVVVTGAGAGIGAGIALRFAELGAAILVHYHTNEAGARTVAAQIEAGGGKAIAVAGDVTRLPEVERVMDRAVAGLGGLDVLVSNAGIYPLHALLEMGETDFRRVVDANLTSVHLCTRAAAQSMIARGVKGAIVNVASIEAHNPAPRHSHYDAAKAGVVMYTRAAAQELGPRGIRVNSVSPGLIAREGLEEAWPDGVSRYRASVPLGRLGEPCDVADACLFLASPAARWVTGVDLVVDGGVLTSTVY